MQITSQLHALKPPSAKNFILIATAVLIILGAFVVSKYQNDANVAQQQQVATLNKAIMTATTSIQNSLVAYEGNWQKSLSGTLGASSTWATGKATPVQNNLTATDLFSRDLFSKYAEYQKAGVNFNDPQIQQQITNQVLADGTYIATPKVYTTKDIVITPDNSLLSVKRYVNSVVTIVKSNTTVHSYEPDIVQNSLNTKNPDLLKQLDPIIASYQNILKNFIATPAPSALTKIHVDLVNAMSEIVFADQSLAKVYSDGITSLAGLSAYQKGVLDLSNAITEIGQYLKSANITFTPTEAGYIIAPNLH